MLFIPAICKNCNAMFSTAPNISVENYTMFVNCESGPCPHCGSMGVIPDGLYTLVDGITHLFSGKHDLTQYKALYVLLKQAKKENWDHDKISR